MTIDGQIPVSDVALRLSMHLDEHPHPAFDPGKVDIPFARKVLEFAQTEHEDFTFDMGCWYAVQTSSMLGPTCGTTACLAGTAVHLTPGAEIVHVNGQGRMIKIDGELYSWTRAGAKLLGLDFYTAASLFSAPATTPQEANAIGLQRLEELIALAEEAQYGGK